MHHLKHNDFIYKFIAQLLLRFVLKFNRKKLWRAQTNIILSNVALIVSTILYMPFVSSPGKLLGFNLFKIV